jgi:hypothetical protein
MYYSGDVVVDSGTPFASTGREKEHFRHDGILNFEVKKNIGFYILQA